MLGIDANSKFQLIQLLKATCKEKYDEVLWNWRSIQSTMPWVLDVWAHGTQDGGGTGRAYLHIPIRTIPIMDLKAAHMVVGSECVTAFFGCDLMHGLVVLLQSPHSYSQGSGLCRCHMCCFSRSDSAFATDEALQAAIVCAFSNIPGWM